MTSEAQTTGAPRRPRGLLGVRGVRSVRGVRGTGGDDYGLSLGLFLGAMIVLDGSGASAEAITTLELPIGSQRMLPAIGVKSYSEGVSGIVDIRLTPDGANFIVVGMRTGSTSLLMLTDDGRERLYHLNVVQAGPSVPSVDYGPGTVAPRANIRLDVFFVQLMDDYTHQVGVRWPGSFGRGSLAASLDLRAGALTDATAVVTAEALPSLDLAQSRGWAKVMRKAAVITANGTEANFSGGGEVNVAVTGGLAGALSQIQYGSEVKVRPRYDSESGRVELSVSADMSDLASDHGTGVPGRSTATLQTVVNLELGQSLLLAGLNTESQSRDHAGLPVLSQIPVLGALFGSHGERHERTQNVIFIVPTVIDAVPARRRAIIDRALARYRAFTGGLTEPGLTESSPTGSSHAGSRHVEDRP